MHCLSHLLDLIIPLLFREEYKLFAPFRLDYSCLLFQSSFYDISVIETSKLFEAWSNEWLLPYEAKRLMPRASRRAPHTSDPPPLNDLSARFRTALGVSDATRLHKLTPSSWCMCLSLSGSFVIQFSWLFSNPERRAQMLFQWLDVFLSYRLYFFRTRLTAPLPLNIHDRAPCLLAPDTLQLKN